MKKVLLIGDSIRKGYDKYVEMAFRDVAEVFYPEENCRFAAYVLRNLHVWARALNCGEDISLVHWNAGLWDDLILFGEEPLTPLDVYESYIERICRRIQLLFPRATMIFATSTAVRENMFQGEMMRYNADTERYNAAASKIVTQYGGRINDLYGVTKDLPPEYFSDTTHLYTLKGTQLLANQVIGVIEKDLGIQANPLDYTALFSKANDVIGI